MPNYEFTPERGFRLDEDRVSVKPQPSLLRALYNNSVALFDAGVVAGEGDAEDVADDVDVFLVGQLPEAGRGEGLLSGVAVRRARGWCSRAPLTADGRSAAAGRCRAARGSVPDPSGATGERSENGCIAKRSLRHH